MYATCVRILRAVVPSALCGHCYTALWHMQCCVHTFTEKDASLLHTRMSHAQIRSTPPPMHMPATHTHTHKNARTDTHASLIHEETLCVCPLGACWHGHVWLGHRRSKARACVQCAMCAKHTLYRSNDRQSALFHGRDGVLHGHTHTHTLSLSLSLSHTHTYTHTHTAYTIRDSPE